MFQLSIHIFLLMNLEQFAFMGVVFNFSFFWII